jgi:hypothetical protein
MYHPLKNIIMTIPSITKRQQDIIHLLYRFRFLNRIQIQTLMGHKDYKTINLWLKDLRAKQYVGWIYSTDYAEISKPAIYYLDINGVRFLNTNSEYSATEIRKRYGEQKRSSQFIADCVTIGDCAIALDSASKDGVRFEYRTHTEFTETEPDADISLDVIADRNCQLAFSKETQDDITWHLLELYPPTLPAAAIQRRLRDYLMLYRQGDWEELTGQDFPILMFICIDTAQLIRVKRCLRRLKHEAGDPEDLQFRLTIRAELREQSVTAMIWEKV